MFLKEIELVNFKCHGHLKLYFTTENPKKPVRKTTFMLGENGTGKSALLKAIALITAGSNALGDILGNPDEWIKNGENHCTISAVIATADNKERNLTLKINKGYHLAEIIKANAESLSLIDEAIKRADRNYFIVAYGASRRLNRSEESFSPNLRKSPRSNNIQSLFFPDAALISLAGWAMDLDYTTAKGTGLTTVKNALNTFLVDNVSFKSIDKKNRRLIFSTPDGNVPLDQLSDGYQNVAAWVGDLMFNITNTFRDHKDPLKARGLLLIDEIDLHLHPKWQRQLHTFIKTKLPNFQIVATTHSPLTAQQAEEGELYALKREKKKVILVPFSGDPSKMLVHQILMSPVFGLPTDESVKVEEAKSALRSQRVRQFSQSAKKPNSGTPSSESKILEESSVNVRSNNLLSEEQLDLLQTINKELKKQK
jgi:hypothetical protein